MTKLFYCCHTIAVIAVFVCLCNCTERSKARPKAATRESNYYSEADFKSVDKINTHVHIRITDTSFLQLAAEYNFRVLNISVNSPSSPPLEKQEGIGIGLIKNFPERVSYATTFTVKNWGNEAWQSITVNHLKQSFDRGAIAVKIWKNIGMALKDTNGKFLMIDDPRFDPVIDFIEKNNKTLVGHLGEPKNCWLPIEKMTVSGDKDYFSTHPQYHVYLHPEYPSYEDLINSKDRMLDKHPQLRFVGAHLASLEWSVDELAGRLDKYPNMAVDMAERISHFQYQAVRDWQKVHDFFMKYQDRLIYATDQRVDSLQEPSERNSQALESWLRHWKFFISDEKMKVPKVGDEFRGLKLPREVVDKIYRTNAEKWFPGIAGSHSGQERF